MFTHRTQPAQSLALIALAMVALIAITALAVDSGNAYAERRRAQSAVDDASLAGALAMINGQNTTNAVYSITSASPSNNFPNATVSIDIGAPFTGCDGNPLNITHLVTSQDPTDSPDYYIQVMIRSSATTFFGQIIGVNRMNYCVQAVARAKPFLIVPPFFGNAVVGVRPHGQSFNDHSNSTKWDITGGGVFANSDAADDHSNVTFHPAGVCATAVGSATGFTCTASSSNPYLFYTPDQIRGLLPRIPACDGTATKGGDDKISAEAGKDGSVWDGGFAGDYNPGLYCITDAGGNLHSGITGVGVTFYIADQDFTLKYNGGGYLGASAPTTDEYKGVLIFSDVTTTPCENFGANGTQSIEIRGNGSTPIKGSILLPSACIDYRGNGQGLNMDSMMVGYTVTSNGDADVAISYNPNDNWKVPQAPIVELTK